jgi:LmbE family N-acetylglucosaminyl deacetylase
MRGKRLYFGRFPRFFADLVDERRPPLRIPTLVIVAHPDDEVIGMGAQLQRLKNATLLHITDGAPKNPEDAKNAGYYSASDYANARRRELENALHIAGASLSNTLELKVRDQEASLELGGITEAVRRITSEIRPRVVFTHPYEGGHPDHDATAFAVHAACARLPRPPCIIEMTSYHWECSRMVTGKFLTSHSREIWTAFLNPEELKIKRLMFNCFKTQEPVLRAFRIDAERFRVAPRYDFSTPPHPGTLYGSHNQFGITARFFNSLAQATLVENGIQGRI